MGNGIRRLPLILWAISIGMGTYGFHSYRGADWDEIGTLSASLYRAVQLLALEFNAPAGAPGKGLAETDPILAAARWIAAVSTLGFVLSLVDDFLRIRLFDAKSWLLRRPRTVMLGFGSVNRALARSLIARGHAVTAVDPEASPPLARMARDMGVLLIAGDVADPGTRRRARLASAGRVHVACGDNEINVEVAGLLARELAGRPPGTLRVHLSNTRLMSDLANAPEIAPGQAGVGLLRPEVFGLKTAAARDMLLQAQLVRAARDRGQDRVHLVIVGKGDFGEAMLVEVLLLGHGPDQRPPRVTVFDCERCGTEARIRATYPQLFDVDAARPGGMRPEIAFAEVDVERVPTEGAGSPFAALGADGDPPTAYVFCCGADHTNLRAALRLYASMRRHRVAAAPIHVRQWDRLPADPARLDRRSLSNIRVFGNAQITAERLVAMEPEIEHLARALHWRHGVDTGRLDVADDPGAPRFADPARFDPRAAALAALDLSHAPEIEVTIDPGDRLDDAHRRALTAAIDRWRRAARPACRMHLRLIPPASFGREVDAGFERWLTGLPGRAGGGLEIDLTVLPRPGDGGADGRGHNHEQGRTA